jgi:hypothetical protein
MVVAACHVGCQGMGPTQMGAVFCPSSLGEVGVAWDSTRWHNDEGGALTRVCVMGSRNPMRPHYLWGFSYSIVRNKDLIPVLSII